MSSAKARILTSIRAALGASATTTHEASAPESAMSTRPQWREPRIERFVDRFVRAAGSWERLESVQRIPAAVSEYLQDSATVRVRLSAQPALRDLQWPAEWDVAVDPQDAAAWPAAVAVAALGVAETGSLVMTSSDACPASGHFLADDHLIVLYSHDIVDYFEEVWERLAATGPSLPRAINMITGPSRTADVEQTLQLGAHGPRRVHLLLIT